MSDELSKLQQYIQDTQQLEQKLDREYKVWDREISILSKKLRGPAKDLYLVDADIANFSQKTTSEIRSYSLIIHKEDKTLKPLIKSRLEWYATKYQVTIKNSGEKMKYVEADVKEIQHRIDILDNHVDFLRGTSDNLKQMGYKVKNRLELLNILGLD